MLNKPINHILVIPDGNRRWAKDHKKSLEETYHFALSTVTTNLIETVLIKHKIKILTIYIISKNNILKRELSEVSAILDNETRVFQEWQNNKKFKRAKIKFNFIGDLSIMPVNYITAAHELIKSTKRNNGPVCNLLAGYDAEDEIRSALKKINNKKIKTILPYLQLKQAIDIVIRTGKEKRLSGAPILQSSYAELMFLHTYYPNLRANLIKKILRLFQRKSRRFGI